MTNCYKFYHISIPFFSNDICYQNFSKFRNHPASVLLDGKTRKTKSSPTFITKSIDLDHSEYTCPVLLCFPKASKVNIEKFKQKSHILLVKVRVSFVLCISWVINTMYTSKLLHCKLCSLCIMLFADFKIS